MVARAGKSDDASRHVFRAQLVVEEMTGERKLRHSKRHGELALDTTTQSAFFVYPRFMRLFQRKFEQPLKCVVGKKLLRVYSSNGKRSFMCRLLSEEDVAKCVAIFSDFGGGGAMPTEVIAVGESMLSTTDSRRISSTPDSAVIVGCGAALRTIREAPQEATRAAIRDYENSVQLQADTETIMSAMFSSKS